MKLQRTALRLMPGLNELPQLHDCRAWLAVDGPPVRIRGDTVPASASAQSRFRSDGTAVVIPMDWSTAIGLALDILQAAKEAKVPLPHGPHARLGKSMG